MPSTAFWSAYGPRAILFGLFLLMVACFGMFAWQGALPLMSPDETAGFAFARHLGQTGSPIITEARASAFSWLHPRSFVAQNGQLLPVGFPLWMVLVSIVGWMGKGGAILWLAVLVSASFVFPLVWLAERALHFSRKEALALALAVGTLPTMILYGNRSLFTLVPQLSLVIWTLWMMQRAIKPMWIVAAGVLAALTIGLRPVEIIWLLPLFLGAMWIWTRDQQNKNTLIWFWLFGLVFGMVVVGGIHAWIYGSPFVVGYLLRDLPAIPTQTATASSAPISWWRPFFPYGFSVHQWGQNIRGTWTMGWWPWIVLWLSTILIWFWQARKTATRSQWLALIGLAGMTVWLSFYYGQGKFADNISGQLFHLGNSLFRYQTPIIVAWTIWSLWVIRTYLPKPWNGRIFFSVAVLLTTLGTHWAFTDRQDGILINREQRQQYAAIRTIVEQESATETIWLSERSDKIVFPFRAAAFIQEPKEVKWFLQTEKQPVWLFRRPPSQTERDRWYVDGLDLVEKHRFDRETIYEVRLRAGYSSVIPAKAGTHLIGVTE